MQTNLSFEPRYHELTCRDGRPVWVPMYNPIRECVDEERQRIQAAGGDVQTRVLMLPAHLRRAVFRTARRQWCVRFAPMLEPILALLTVALLVGYSALVGAVFVTAYDPVWFKSLNPFEEFAVFTLVGVPVVALVFSFTAWSWWDCVTSH
jgi:hypothetical protein